MNELYALYSNWLEEFIQCLHLHMVFMAINFVMRIQKPRIVFQIMIVIHKCRYSQTDFVYRAISKRFPCFFVLRDVLIFLPPSVLLINLFECIEPFWNGVDDIDVYEIFKK